MKYDQPEDIWEGVASCQVHQHHDEDCDGCQGEVTARSARIDQLQAAAQDVLKDIARHGGPTIPPQVVLEVRLDVLLDSLFSNPKDRLRYEGEVGRRVMVQIKDMQQQIKQPTLHIPKGNVRPLR